MVKISVIIPVYNIMKGLKLRISSFLPDWQ